MEDETDNQPSFSKKESQRVESTEERENRERRKDEERRERGSNSEDSFTSGSYCPRSRIDIAEARPEVPKPPLGKREAKPTEKKKRTRRPGRVDKRRRSPARRQVLRRASKRKPRKQRNLSVSTILTRFSSQSESRSLGCKFCGHRCCRRRYELQKPRRKYRKRKMKINKQRKIPLPALVKIKKGTKKIQVGSRSYMLSPLFINTNAVPDEVTLETISCCEITPAMIYESLRRLTMWRQSVLKVTIMEYLKTHYPVSRDDKELQVELTEKLRIATVVGFVVSVGEDRWCLNCGLEENRTLSKSHVTKFWQLYADTMTPIRRQENAKNSDSGKCRVRTCL